MEVRIWDGRLSIDDEDTELIKTVNGMEMYKDLDFGGFIVIDGQSYRQIIYKKEKDILYVEPVELDEKGSDIEYSDEFVCPYCGTIDDNARELEEDQGETECVGCGSDLKYEIKYTVEYNIRPVKCAPITRV